MEDGYVVGGGFGDNVLDQAVKQFCSILDRELGVGGKLVMLCQDSAL